MDKFNSESDLDLMQKITGLDLEAFGELYDRYANLLYSVVKEILGGNRVAAEKVLEEIFMIVWNHSNEFDFNSGNVFTWLVLLARNKANDEYKRKNAEEVPPYTDEYESEYILPQLSPDIKTIELNQALHSRNTVLTAIKELTDSQRHVLMVLFAGGTNEDTIAKKLSIPESTVRIKLQAALNTIREKTENIIA